MEGVGLGDARGEGKGEEKGVDHLLGLLVLFLDCVGDLGSILTRNDETAMLSPLLENFMALLIRFLNTCDILFPSIYRKDPSKTVKLSASGSVFMDNTISFCWAGRE